MPTQLSWARPKLTCFSGVSNALCTFSQLLDCLLVLAALAAAVAALRLRRYAIYAAATAAVVLAHSTKMILLTRKVSISLKEAHRQWSRNFSTTLAGSAPLALPMISATTIAGTTLTLLTIPLRVHSSFLNLATVVWSLGMGNMPQYVLHLHSNLTLLPFLTFYSWTCSIKYAYSFHYTFCAVLD